MNKWELELKIAEMLEEAKEEERFRDFCESLPLVAIRRRTEESHLPLMWITTAENKSKYNKNYKE